MQLNSQRGGGGTAEGKGEEGANSKFNKRHQKRLYLETLYQVLTLRALIYQHGFL